MSSHGSRYSVGDLNLDRINVTDELTLVGRVVEGRVAFSEFTHSLDTLQQYTGFSNKQMLAMLEEVLYSGKLEPFTPGAGDFLAADINTLTENINARGIRFAGSGERNGISQSQAQLALSTILLTAVPARTTSGLSDAPVLVVDPPAGYPQSLVSPDGEFGFDHVLAGAMGDPDGVPSGLANVAIDLLTNTAGGSDVQLTGNNANTWVGDLVAVVSNSGVRQVFHGGNPEKNDSYEQFEQELGELDRISDVIGATFEVDPGGHNLGAALAEHMAPYGDAFQNKFANYAAEVGLEYNSDGQITNRDEFVESWSPVLTAMSVGFVVPKPALAQMLASPSFQPSDPGTLWLSIPGGQPVLLPPGEFATNEKLQAIVDEGNFEAGIALNRWVDYVETGLTAELQ